MLINVLIAFSCNTKLFVIIQTQVSYPYRKVDARGTVYVLSGRSRNAIYQTLLCLSTCIRVVHMRTWFDIGGLVKGVV